MAFLQTCTAAVVCSLYYFIDDIYATCLHIFTWNSLKTNRWPLLMNPSVQVTNITKKKLQEHKDLSRCVPILEKTYVLHSGCQDVSDNVFQLSCRLLKASAACLCHVTSCHVWTCVTHWGDTCCAYFTHWNCDCTCTTASGLAAIKSPNTHILPTLMRETTRHAFISWKPKQRN